MGAGSTFRPGSGDPYMEAPRLAELVFVSVLGLLSIFLVLGVLGAVSEARAGVGPRPEVLGFLAAVLLLLLLGGFAYTSLFGPTP